MNNNLNNEWKYLLRYCADNKINVKLVKSSVLKDYAGMNDEAAKGIPGFKRLPNKTILIDESMPLDIRVETLRHECIEMQLMEKGKKYWPAHKIALKREKDKNWPIRRVRKVR